MSLEDYGWDQFFSASFDAQKNPDHIPGRITSANRGIYVVQTGQHELQARMAGKLRQAAATGDATVPVVGDWIAGKGTGDGSMIIQTVLGRKSLLSRKDPGRPTTEQAVAANVDTVFLVMGLDANFNLRRMERLLAMTYESGASPVILLNKTDVAGDRVEQALEVESIAPGVPVFNVSARTGHGLEELSSFLRRRGHTIVFVGSSGVGKSTLINRLFQDEVMRTQAVRETDGRGRHTTSHRELFKHPEGALLIDNPGLREIQLWCSEEAVSDAFSEIASLSAHCRFRDCTHTSEPACAVKEAAENGTLAPDRLESYRKLSRELRYLELKQDEGAQRAQKQRWRAIHKAMRQNPKS